MALDRPVITGLLASKSQSTTSAGGQLSVAADERARSPDKRSSNCAFEFIKSAQKRNNKAPVEQLTARELDVLTLIGQGRTNAEIGLELGISAVTVKTHVSHIFDKLGLRDRAAAIVYAFDRGIVTPETTVEIANPMAGQYAICQAHAAEIRPHPRALAPTRPAVGGFPVSCKNE